MQDLDHLRIFKQAGQRLPVAYAQRIDQVGPCPVTDLDQTGFRIEGIDPHELGVECHEGQRAPLQAVLCQAAIVANPVNIDGHKALPQTMARSIYGAGHRRETTRPLSLPPLPRL
ncbi:hypothetical protein D3C84_984200 [compost metagenome]